MTKSKQQLLSQKVISVCNPDFPTPAMIEFIGKLGFDGVFLDCEHSSTDFQLINDLTRAARLTNLHSLVRPWSNDPGLINRYLSCGAGGVQAPHVHSAEDARRIIEGLKRWGDGNYDPAEVMVLLAKNGFDGFLLDDHVPKMDNDSDWNHRGRARQSAGAAQRAWARRARALPSREAVWR